MYGAQLALIEGQEGWDIPREENFNQESSDNDPKMFLWAQV